MPLLKLKREDIKELKEKRKVILKKIESVCWNFLFRQENTL